MPSGMIGLEAWRQRLMPMLVERARTRLPGWPQVTGQDHPVLDLEPDTLRYISPIPCGLAGWMTDRYW
jgi:hypothetical protein